MELAIPGEVLTVYLYAGKSGVFAFFTVIHSFELNAKFGGSFGSVRFRTSPTFFSNSKDKNVFNKHHYFIPDFLNRWNVPEGLTSTARIGTTRVQSPLEL